MSIRDKICSIADSAMYMEKQGKDINKAIASLSKGISLAAVERVVETVNVNKFAELMSSGQDRTTEFPLADYEKISSMVVEDDFKDSSLKEKRASVTSLDFYFSPQHEAADQDLMVKAAEHKESKFETVDTQLKWHLKIANLKKMQKEKIEEAETSLHYKATDLFRKLAQSIYLNKEAAQEVYDNIYTRYGDSCAPFLAILSSSIKVPVGELKKQAFFDDSLPHVKTMDDFMSGMLSLRKIAELKKKAKEEKSIMGKLFAIKPMKEVDKQTGIGIGKALKSPGKGIGLGAAAAGKVVGRLGGKGLGLIGALMASAAPEKKKKVDTSEQELDQFMNTIKHKAVFEDLIANDEILRERDPATLARLYETMVSISPTVATDKNIVRSYLREAATEDVLGHFTAMQLADLERKLKGVPDKMIMQRG